MGRTTIKELSDRLDSAVSVIDQLIERNQGEQLATANVTERLDKASDFCKQLNARVQELEAQAEKTRKQLWYLQKIAKGEFQPQVPKKNGNTEDGDPIASREAHENSF